MIATVTMNRNMLQAIWLWWSFPLWPPG